MKRKSWKTTVGGLIMALAPAAAALLPQHVWIKDAMLSIGAAILGSVARDNTVTSEEVGAK